MMLRLIFTLFIILHIGKIFAIPPYNPFDFKYLEVMTTAKGSSERIIKLEQDGLVSLNYSLFEEGTDSHILRVSWYDLDKKKLLKLQNFISVNLELYDALARNPNITRTDFFIRRIVIIRDATYGRVYVIKETENVDKKVNELIKLLNELIPEKERKFFEFPLS